MAEPIEFPYVDATEFAAALRGAGSGNALADQLGIGRTTVRKWVHAWGVNAVEPLRPRVHYADLIPEAEAWNGPRATLVPPASGKGATEQTAVIISDIHSPYHDVTALRSALALIDSMQPDLVVINGDLPDFFGISSHNKTMERLDSLQHELDMADDIRRAIRKAAPNATIRENEGNHDSRLRTFVRSRARELSSLRCLAPENLSAWTELDIHPHGGAGFLIQPGFLIKHGNVVRGEAGASARGEMKRYKVSGITGHVHRLAQATEDGYKRLEWYEGGCLCQLDPDYVAGGPPNWRHGLTVLYASTKTDAFQVDMVKAGEDGRFRYGGISYGV